VKRAAALVAAVLLGAAVRWPFWQVALGTPLDADTSIVGAMARHPSFVATFWGQPYGSPVEAWLARLFLLALGPSATAVRVCYFVLGLLLVPVAWFAASALDRAAAWPTALLLAAPPSYFLLLGSMPPPLYPLALVLAGVILGLGLRAGRRLDEGDRPLGLLALWGFASGLALWTHLMTASVVGVTGLDLALRIGRSRGRRIAPVLAAALPLLVAAAPLGLQFVAARGLPRVVRVSAKNRGLGGHLAGLVPQLDQPLLGVLGAHAPQVADEPLQIPAAPWAVALLVLVYGGCVAAALLRARRDRATRVALAAAGLALVAFLFPLRSGVSKLRFLTPLYMPIAALAAATPGRRARYAVVGALMIAHASGQRALLANWRSLDPQHPPWGVTDLDRAREYLQARGVRHAYASYEPAWRLTYEGGLVVSQPENQRFQHFPLPFLDEVRFAKGVAWVLTPELFSDLPKPAEFEAELRALGGSYESHELGACLVFDDFAPPFSPIAEEVEAPKEGKRLTIALEPARRLDAATLLAAPPARLPSGFDLEWSADGKHYEPIARYGAPGGRRLAWANGQPQLYADLDGISVVLDGRSVAALRFTSTNGNEAFRLAAALVHPSTPPEERASWGEWLPAAESWPERRQALLAQPRPERIDWRFRRLLVERH
jgi:hypothetical protein